MTATRVFPKILASTRATFVGFSIFSILKNFASSSAVRPDRGPGVITALSGKDTRRFSRTGEPSQKTGHGLQSMAGVGSPDETLCPIDATVQYAFYGISFLNSMFPRRMTRGGQTCSPRTFSIALAGYQSSAETFERGIEKSDPMESQDVRFYGENSNMSRPHQFIFRKVLSRGLRAQVFGPAPAANR